MALKDEAIEAIWKGHANFLDEIGTSIVTPNAARDADFMRQLVYDTAADDWYIHVGATVATQTWTKVAG